jgi:hypothetical protein
MSDEQNKNTELAKKLVEISLEDRRQLQYCAMKKWDSGLLTGVQAIEEILSLEKIIKIDIDHLRRARGGQIQKQQNGKNNPKDK